MTRRRRLLGVAIAAAFVLGGLAAEWLIYPRGLRLAAVIDLLAGCVLAGAGLAAWVVSPRSRVGPLLMASGAGWFIGTLAVPTTAFGRSDLGWLAAFLVQCHVGFLVHATATWPSGRVTRPTQLAIVAGGYIAALFVQIWYQAPGYLVLGGLLAVGVLIDHHSLARSRRAAYRPGRDAGLLLAGAIAFIPSVSRALADVGWVVLGTGATLWAIAVALVGVVLAVGLIRRERRGAVADLAVVLQERGVSGFGDEPERVLRDATAAETTSDPEVGAALARAAALAQRNQALRQELAARVEELEASRRRLVEVGDEELRALVERLGGGARARLEALEQAVRSLVDAGSLEPFATPVVGQRLARTGEQLAAALTELDALATGLDPGRVTERGLDVALRDLAATSPVPVELAIALPRPAGASVATTLYFVASEALANVVRHARARAAWLQLSDDGGDWLLIVEDDGQGGADVGRGTGLRGLQERVEALGGSLRVGARTGGGTRLEAMVPGAPLTGLA
jgi:hypothetical protein